MGDKERSWVSREAPNGLALGTQVPHKPTPTQSPQLPINKAGSQVTVREAGRKGGEPGSEESSGKQQLEARRLPGKVRRANKESKPKRVWLPSPMLHHTVCGW